MGRSVQRVVSVSALAFSLAAGAGLARAQDNGVVDSGVVLRVQGGGYSPLAHLDEFEEVDFKSGYNVGGGLAYQFSRYFALRGNFTWARAEARDNGAGTLAPIAGVEFDRFLYDADLQFRYPFRSGVAPYVFVGGGAVTVKERDTQIADEDSFTKGAGKFGLGINYQIPRSRASLYVEGATWAYKWDRYGYDKTQFDVGWSGGISYGF